jgi:Rap1a immunity proteins
MQRLFLSMAFFCLMTVSARSGFMDGNALHDFCENKNSEHICFGYVVGATDQIVIANQLWSLAARGKTFAPGEYTEAADSLKFWRMICLPVGVRANALTDTVKLWLRDNSHRRHESASILVVDALREKFPCKPKE